MTTTYTLKDFDPDLLPGEYSTAAIHLITAAVELGWTVVIADNRRISLIPAGGGNAIFLTPGGGENYTLLMQTVIRSTQKKDWKNVGTVSEREFPVTVTHVEPKPAPLVLPDVEYDYVEKPKKPARKRVEKVAPVKPTPEQASNAELGLLWKDPAPAKAGRNVVTEASKIVEALKARPGEWASIGIRSRGYASNVKNGGSPSWRPVGHFDATARSVPGEPRTRGEVFVRYVGPS